MKKADTRESKAASRQLSLKIPIIHADDPDSKPNLIAPLPTSSATTQSKRRSRNKKPIAKSTTDESLNREIKNADNERTDRRKDADTGHELLTEILDERRRNWQGRGAYKEPAQPVTQGLPPLPAHWTWATLEQICPMFADSAHRTPKYGDTGFPALGPRDIVGGRLNLAKARLVNASEFAIQTARHAPQPGDIVYSRELSLGWGAIVPEGQPLCLSQGMCVFRPHESVDSRFFLAFLNGPFCRKYAENAAVGSAHPHLNLGDIKAYVFPLPPISEQRRIVAEIEKQFTRLDVGVAALKRVQVNLNRYRAAVLKAACEGKLVPTEAELARQEGRTYETGEQLLQRILTERRKNWQGKGSFAEPLASDSLALPQLPAGWTWARLEQLSNVVRGASPRPAGDSRYFGGTVPWITVGPLTADNSPYLKAVSASLSELGRQHSRYIEPDTLLLTNSGATLGVPKITLIGGCINDGVAALLELCNDSKLYVLYFLRTQTERLRSVNQGAAQPNLNTSIIKDICVPFPPMHEQARIVAEVERRLSVVEELESVVVANLQRAHRLRQSVLQNAFSGNL